jgi:addiction module HigA family antidote
MSYARRTPAAWAIHPGEILKEEFMVPLGISVYALAKAIKVPLQAVHELVANDQQIR